MDTICRLTCTESLAYYQVIRTRALKHLIIYIINPCSKQHLIRYGKLKNVYITTNLMFCNLVRECCLNKILHLLSLLIRYYERCNIFQVVFNYLFFYYETCLGIYILLFLEKY